MGDIIVVDDEESMREFLDIFLTRQGHGVRTADSVTAAMALMEKIPADIVVSDLRMQGELDGLKLLHQIKEKGYPTEVILVTAFASPETAIAAMKEGAYDYLTKPFKIDEIGAVISRALERRALVTENATLKQKVAGKYQLGSLLGRSEPMLRVFELVRKVAATNTSVLITGESGTGKELVARALHTESPRAEMPFVAINCGAIPAELMESELFGHVKGAFTGAIGEKLGLFRAANGGTLFLDEIGELSLSLQVKLLRALQERKVKAVGSSEEVAFDIRVVAATNRDLEDEVESGAFRQDLYYRLNVIEVRLPALRQRQEDIILLANHFLKRFASEQSSGVTSFSSETLKRLEGYDYPGNVRELENIVERAVTLSTESEVTPDVLPAMKTRRQPRPSQELDFPLDLERVLGDFERQLITRAMKAAEGKRKIMSDMLGVTSRSLRYRLAKLGIEVSDKS